MDNKQLLALRKQIDEIDEKIINNLEERAGLVQEVGELKKQHDSLKDSNFIRSGREATMMAAIVDRFHKFPKVNAFEIWRNIITSSLKLEGGLEIALTQADIEDIEVSKAIFRYFGTSLEVKTFTDLGQVFASVEANKNQVGICAKSTKILPNMPKNIQIFAKIAPNAYVFARLQPEAGVADKTVILHGDVIEEIDGYYNNNQELQNTLKSSKTVRILGSYSPLPI